QLSLSVAVCFFSERFREALPVHVPLLFRCGQDRLYICDAHVGEHPSCPACRVHFLLENMFRQKTVLHRDRKSTRLNSSHVSISYAVFCLKKKSTTKTRGPGCTACIGDDCERRDRSG